MQIMRVSRVGRSLIILSTPKRKKNNNSPLIVAIGGASGVVYALGLLRELGKARVPVDLVASSMGRDMLRREAGIPAGGGLLEYLPEKRIDTGTFRVFDNEDLGAPIASGSYQSSAMVVCPCSVKTLSAVAAGSCRTLIERAAEVTLKERRKLVLVVRESPYSLVQIENMRSATLAGAVILPASPAFYHRPAGIGDLVDFITARILDQLKISHNLVQPWNGRD